MKKKRVKQQLYRVADFEYAIEKSAYCMQISIVIYMAGSLYVEKIIGFVEWNSREIRIAWNHGGESFVAGERTPEFDLKLFSDTSK